MQKHSFIKIFSLKIKRTWVFLARKSLSHPSPTYASVLQEPHFYMQNRTKPDKNRCQVGEKGIRVLEPAESGFVSPLKTEEGWNSKLNFLHLSTKHTSICIWILCHLISLLSNRTKPKHRLKI